MEAQAIFAAKNAINGLVSRTPLLYSPLLSLQYQCEIWLKLETLQPIGAFKLRGATHAMNKLTNEQKRHGVVTCSTGNHGRAVAYAGQRLGVRTVICMSNLVPKNKVDAIKALGAEVRIVGQAQDDAEREALRLTEQESMTYLSPFEHPDIIAGQGTIGLEILEDLPEVDVIFAGLSGGGLIGGIGLRRNPTAAASKCMVSQWIRARRWWKVSKRVSPCKWRNMSHSLTVSVAVLVWITVIPSIWFSR